MDMQILTIKKHFSIIYAPETEKVADLTPFYGTVNKSYLKPIKT